MVDTSMAHVETLIARNDALIDALHRLVKHEPLVYDQVSGLVHCGYCKAAEPPRVTEPFAKHADDCIWWQAREVLAGRGDG